MDMIKLTRDEFDDLTDEGMGTVLASLSETAHDGGAITLRRIGEAVVLTEFFGTGTDTAYFRLPEAPEDAKAFIRDKVVAYIDSCDAPLGIYSWGLRDVADDAVPGSYRDPVMVVIEDEDGPQYARDERGVELVFQSVKAAKGWIAEQKAWRVDVEVYHVVPQQVGMTPVQLAGWQKRMGFSDAEAARRLGIPYRTFREYTPAGRRRKGHLPGWLPVLCGYIERDAQAKTA